MSNREEKLFQCQIRKQILRQCQIRNFLKMHTIALIGVEVGNSQATYEERRGRERNILSLCVCIVYMFILICKDWM